LHDDDRDFFLGVTEYMHGRIIHAYRCTPNSVAARFGAALLDSVVDEGQI
jgi:hypothetical protein